MIATIRKRSNQAPRPAVALSMAAKHCAPRSAPAPALPSARALVCCTKPPSPTTSRPTAAVRIYFTMPRAQAPPLRNRRSHRALQDGRPLQPRLHVVVLHLRQGAQLPVCLEVRAPVRILHPRSHVVLRPLHEGVQRPACPQLRTRVRLLQHHGPYRVMWAQVHMLPARRPLLRTLQLPARLLTPCLSVDMPNRLRTAVHHHRELTPALLQAWRCLANPLVLHH